VESDTMTAGLRYGAPYQYIIIHMNVTIVSDSRFIPTRRM
jgi:hypothetical protein